jgi:hypothetical protein
MYSNFKILFLLTLLIALATSTATSQEATKNYRNIRMHPSSNLGIFGNLENAGMFNQNRGTVYFAGGISQLIDGNRDILFQNIIFDNRAGVRLNNNVTASSTVVFRNGIVTTQRTTPSIEFKFGDNATYTNASDTRHIDGYCGKYGADNFMFPVGDPRWLRPIGVSNLSSNVDTFSGAYFRGNPTAAILPIGAPFPISIRAPQLSKVSNTEYWDMSGASDAILTLTWDANSLIDNLVDGQIDKLVVAGWNGAQWVNLGGDNLVGNLSSGHIDSRSLVPDSFNVYTLAKTGNNCRSNITTTLNLGADRNICQADRAYLNAGTGYTRYQWSNGATDSAIFVTTSGQYWVRAWDSCGNTQIDTMNIKVIHLPQIASVTPVSCQGKTDGRINLTDTLGALFWVNGSLTPPAQLQNLSAGNYHLQIRGNQSGCIIDSLLVIGEPTAGKVEIGQDTAHVAVGGSMPLTATPINGFLPVSYKWYPEQRVSCANCQTTVASPVGVNVFRVVATDATGCVAIDDITIYTDRKFGIYIPNAFKPDNEGFTILGNETVAKVNVMRIYDRWGELVFEAKDFKPNGTVRWNGTFREKPLNTGTFVVVAEVLFVNGEVRKYSQDLLLAR